jgi:ABC-2 type transport system ATP-binding protein
METVVEIENLTKDYTVGFLRKRPVHALSDLTLTVNRGEIFGFLGANGAGKTTTIKLLMSLIYPTSGNARILGHDIQNVSMHRYVGYLPEHPYFYDYLTARELLEYFAEIFGYNKRERRRRAEELLTRVHLEEKHWDKHLRKFSKGMLQRVGLAQALINDPEVVFLDEPMSGLDPIGRREVRDLITSLRINGVTVFFSSHILSDIEVLCDRIAIMRSGKLAYVGTLGNLHNSVRNSGRMEITIANVVGNKSFIESLRNIEAVKYNETPSGVRVEVKSEEDVDEVIIISRQHKGTLVSVLPVRQSLEDFFISETFSDH